MEEEIIKRLGRIFLTLTIFCFLTITWMNLNENYAYANVLNERAYLYTDESLYIDDLEKISDTVALHSGGYVFQVENDDKVSNNFTIKVVNDYYNKYNFEKTNNSYIKYQIRKNDEEFSEIKYLDADGYIYYGKLKEYEMANFEIKLWVDDTYDGDINFIGNILFYFR